MGGHPHVVDIFREPVCRPFVPSVERSDGGMMNRVLVVLDSFPSYHRVVAAGAYFLVVMRDGKAQNFPIDLVFSIHSTKELGDGPYRNGHAVSVLPVRNGERLVGAGRSGRGSTCSTWP